MARLRRSVDRRNPRVKALEDGDATVSLPPWGEVLVGGDVASGFPSWAKVLVDGDTGHRPTPEDAERGAIGASGMLA
jgi:hypothetical protein